MNEFKRIRVLSCDHLNLARGKYLPVEHRKKRPDEPVAGNLCRGL